MQVRYPALHAEAVATLLLMRPPAEVAATTKGCLAAAREGLAGIDFLYEPYDTEADWRPMHRIAERAAAAGPPGGAPRAAASLR